MKILACTLMALLAVSAANALETGEKAPPLKVDLWLNGDAVNPAEPDGETLYVIEFWATWCPPCRKSIPHLNELQAKWKDQKVVIVGISDEPEETVRPFAEKMKMSYHVAIDTNRATVDVYMKDVSGIPHAFVVNRDGVVVWSGHPMSGLEETVDQLLAGTFNMEDAKALQRTEDELQELIMGGEYEKAAEKAEELIKQAGPKMDYFQMLLGLLAQTGDSARFPEIYGRMQQAFENDADSLNTLAWIACTSPFSMCDLEIAARAAARAVQLSERKDASHLDTLARVHYALGMLDEAIAVQQEAVEASSGEEEERADLQATLAYYQAARDTRTKLAGELAPAPVH
ncbi:MAG TPA: TlpA disulfide reductase family protein [Kiritimatiellia bacterium]|nr:TlpA disulfide reductase family protein [Kiritimatiellia bacterium]HSA19213.1 TlpA disulfide reductase family protein [Kiritimatiellia bacterium]